MRKHRTPNPKSRTPIGDFEWTSTNAPEVDQAAFAASSPNKDCADYINASRIDCPPQTADRKVRVSFNEFGIFAGYGVAAQRDGVARLVIPVEVFYKPICYNGARLSGCAEVRAGGQVGDDVIVERHAFVGGSLLWR